jgi:Cupin-like domain
MLEKFFPDQCNSRIVAYSMPSVERRERLSAEMFLQEYRIPRRPVIISDVAADWPAISSWSFDNLRQSAGAMRVYVRSRTTYSNGVSTRGNEDESEVTLSTLLDYFQSQDCPDLSYARQIPLSDFGPLGEDVKSPPYVTEPARYPEVWMGPADTVTQLHWDPAHNLFAQIRGRKHVVLVSPDEASRADPNQFSIAYIRSELVRRARLVAQLAAIEAELGPPDADFDRNRLRALLAKHLDARQRRFLFNVLAGLNAYHADVDRVSRLTRWEATLGPGEILFIPFMWRHQVRSLEPSVSVNWFLHPSELSGKELRSVLLDTLAQHLH